MRVVHLIFKVAVHGQGYLAAPHLADVWVSRSWKTNLTSDITWRHAVPLAK